MNTQVYSIQISENVLKKCWLSIEFYSTQNRVVSAGVFDNDLHLLNANNRAKKKNGESNFDNSHWGNQSNILLA